MESNRCHVHREIRSFLTMWLLIRSEVALEIQSTANTFDVNRLFHKGFIHNCIEIASSIFSSHSAAALRNL